MRVVVIVVAGALVALSLASQLLVPGLAESAIEDRLTERGGEARAAVSAFPAARLLVGDGDELRVTGTGLDLDLSEQRDVFESLDGFDRVEISLDAFDAGPFEIRSFDLSRHGDGPYTLRSASSTTPAALLAYGADSLGLFGGPLLGLFAGRVPGGDRRIPIALEMEMESDEGRIRVTEGGGTIAGYPAGPLAELITATIVVRL